MQPHYHKSGLYSPNIINFTSSYLQTTIRFEMIKKYYLLPILFLSILTHNVIGQIGYSPMIDSLINEVTIESISELNKQLSGYEETTIGGDPFTITTRFWNSYENEMAAQWLFERFEEHGYSPEYQTFEMFGENIVAELTGTEFPNSYFIICAHYDDVPWSGIAPGADDNASGVVAVLEAARLLKDFDSPYTIKFILFDKEEQGLYGSEYYAYEAAANSDDIMGVLNFDMIAWDSDSNFEYDIATNTHSSSLKNDYATVSQMYQPEMPFNKSSSTSSDHYPFWQVGYKAIMMIEDSQDFNINYHTTEDNFENLNLEFFHKMVKGAVASLATLAWDFKINIQHEPLLSGYYLEDRIATAVISSYHGIDSGDNEPRLYYRVDSGSFESVLPFYNVADTFQFMLPAQTLGTQVEYYIAAQDEYANFVTTMPSGGRGIDPPGQFPPSDLYYYEIDEIYNLTYCSHNTPLTIYDKVWIYDTINIETEGYIEDINVIVDISHTRAGDLAFWLISPDGEEVLLSLQNGGNGQDYNNTVFDDDAEFSITESYPPFTGSFIPQGSLSDFNGKNVAGSWALRLFDFHNNNEGTLVDWCVSITYKNGTTGVVNKTAMAKLEQNFPNPANNQTTIMYSLERSSIIDLSIYDFYGRLVKNVDTGTKPKGNYSATVNVLDMNPGTYFYVLTTDEGYYTRPLIITW